MRRFLLFLLLIPFASASLYTDLEYNNTNMLQFNGSTGLSWSPSTTGATWTYSAWVYLGSNYSGQPAFFDSQSGRALLRIKSADTGLEYYDNTPFKYFGTYQLSVGQWEYITFVESGGTVTLYVNGSSVASNSSNSHDLGGNSYIGSNYVGTSDYWSGNMTCIKMWDRNLNSTDVASIYGIDGSCTTISSGENFTVQAIDIYNSSALIGFSATINGTEYNTSGSIITTPINNSWGGIINLTVRDSNYFNYSETNYNSSSDLTALMYPYTRVSAINGTGSLVMNFSVTYYQIGNTSYTGTTSTTNGYAWIPIQNGTFNVTIYDAESYGRNYSSASSTETASPYLQNVQFTLSTTNSINFSFYDETTLSLIDDRLVSVYVTGSLASYNFSTSTGTYFIDMLTPQNYTITYSASGYSEREYNFNLVNQSSAELDLYLLNSSTADLIVFSLKDTAQKIVADAQVIAQKKNLSGTNYYTVEMCTTDSNGQCLLNLELYYTTYLFIVKKDGVIRSIVPSSGDTKITSTSVNLVVQLLEDTLADIEQLQDVSGVITYNNNTEQFSFTYSDNNNLELQACLEVSRRKGGSTTLLSESCSSSSSGTITYSINASTGDSFTAKGYVVSSTYGTILVDELGVVTGNLQEQLGVLGLYIFGFIIAGTVAFVGLWNPIVACTLLVAVLLISNWLGFIGLGGVAVGGLIGLLGLVVYLTRS